MNYGDILKGWFDRDGSKYVKLIHTGRLDWESTIDMSKGISLYAYGKVDNAKLLERAYSFGKTTLGAMAIPYRTTLKLSKDRSCTDSKNVWVATSSFDRADLTPNQKLDVFLGLTIHEACHIKYTDFSAVEKYGDKLTQIIHHLWNTIEDEYIETSLADDAPGFMSYLAYIKWYHFDLLYQEEEKKALKETVRKVEIESDRTGEVAKPIDRLDEATVLDRLMSITFKLVRYPKYLKDEDFKFLGKYIIDIKAVLYPYPKNTQECLEAAFELWEIFKRFYKEPPKSSGGEGAGDKAKGGSSDDDKGEPTSGDGKTEKDKPSSGEGKEGEDDFEGMEISIEVSEESAGDIEKDLEKSLSSGVLKVLKEVTPEIKSPEKPDGSKDHKLDEEDLCKELRKDPVKAKILEGSVSVGEGDGVYFTRQGDNPGAYRTAYNEVRTYVPVIKRSLKNHGRDHKVVYKGMRSGHLDVSKLAEAFQGVSTVYERSGQVKSDKISVVLLVDESGSMSGRNKIESARQSAILLKEALSEIGYINLFIYGHSGDQIKGYSTDINVYKEPGWEKRFSMGNIKARYQNRDGVAIYETAKRVRRFTNEPTLMFIISDGEPAAGGYYGSGAIQHTKQMVRKVEAMNIQVVQVCIETSYNPKDMFTNFITLTDMNRLAKDLSLAINKAAKKLSKVVTS